jgi:chemotaxis signal transduction protein
VGTIIKIIDLATKLGTKSAEPIERSAITVADIYDIFMGLAMDHVSYSRRPSMDTPIPLQSDH